MSQMSSDESDGTEVLRMLYQTVEESMEHGITEGCAVKKGLVLEGGGMRGLFSAGAMDVMMENGIVFDGIVGTSIGAAFGSNYKSGQSGRAQRYSIRYCADRRFCGLLSFITTGNMFNADFCYREIPTRLDPFDCEAFRRNPADFYAVCTDIDTGEVNHRRCDGSEDDLTEWFRASCAYPFFSRIVRIGDRRFLDGCITDPVPIRFFEDLGYDRNVVILTSPLERKKREGPFILLLLLRYWRHPGLKKSIREWVRTYNGQREYLMELSKNGKVFVIAPDDGRGWKIVEKDPERNREVYEEGRRAMLERMDELKEFLGTPDLDGVRSPSP